MARPVPAAVADLPIAMHDPAHRHDHGPGHAHPRRHGDATAAGHAASATGGTERGLRRSPLWWRLGHRLAAVSVLIVAMWAVIVWALG